MHCCDLLLTSGLCSNLPNHTFLGFEVSLSVHEEALKIYGVSQWMQVLLAWTVKRQGSGQQSGHDPTRTPYCRLNSLQPLMSRHKRLPKLCQCLMSAPTLEYRSLLFHQLDYQCLCQAGHSTSFPKHKAFSLLLSANDDIAPALI